MQVCIKCKENTVENANFCHNCGYPQKAAVLRQKRMTLTTDSIPAAETANLNRQPSPFPKDGRLVLAFGDKELSLPVTRRLILGRESEANNPSLIDLTQFGAWEKGVSRNHAAIRLLHGKTLVLEDLASANGTFINGKGLNPLTSYSLRDGDRIHFAKLAVTLHFRAPQEKPETAENEEATPNPTAPLALGSKNIAALAKVVPTVVDKPDPKSVSRN